MCRFGGHCEIYYPVAQHCVLGSYHCDDPLEFLMHDAAEAYLVDMPRPIKNCFSIFEELENKIMEAIAEKFGLRFPFLECVHETDNRILATERLYLLGQQAMWKLPECFPPLEIDIEQWTPAFAEKQFLERFKELTTQNGISAKTA